MHKKTDLLEDLYIQQSSEKIRLKSNSLKNRNFSTDFEKLLLVRILGFLKATGNLLGLTDSF